MIYIGTFELPDPSHLPGTHHSPGTHRSPGTYRSPGTHHSPGTRKGYHSISFPIQYVVTPLAGVRPHVPARSFTQHVAWCPSFAWYPRGVPLHVWRCRVRSPPNTLPQPSLLLCFLHMYLLHWLIGYMYITDVAGSFPFPPVTFLAYALQ
jgi:hypothetical protein